MVGELRSVRLPARTVFSVRAAFACGILLLLLWSLASQPLPRAVAAGGTTYTVNSTDDPGDGVCTAAHCTLREAILAANAVPGRDTIVFAFSGTPPFTIRPTSALPVITDTVVIDGLSLDRRPPRTRPVVELDGSLAGGDASGLDFETSDSVVNGLIINRFAQDGILIDGGSDFTITGNLIGTDATGTVGRGNGRWGLEILGVRGLRVGGLTAHERNVLSGSRIGLVVTDGEGVTIQGNYFGTDVTGLRPIGGWAGAVLSGATRRVRIGGLEPGAANVFAAHFDLLPLPNGAIRTGLDVEVDSSVESNEIDIVGNLVGVGADGLTPMGNTFGIAVFGGRGIRVGPGNLVANSGFVGILLFGAKAAVVRDNRWIGNQGLGIKVLNSNGGIDSIFRLPVLTAVRSAGGGLRIEGLLQGQPPDTEAMLDFYSAPVSHPSGHGEATALLGSTTVRTDAEGNAIFAVSFTKAPVAGQFVSATVWSEELGTTEFSIALPVGNAPCEETHTVGEVAGGAGVQVAPLWVSRFNRGGPLLDEPALLTMGGGVQSPKVAAVPSPDGRTLFVGGKSVAMSDFGDWTVLAIEAATGRVRWAQHVDGPGHAIDELTALAISPDGSRLFATGVVRHSPLPPSPHVRADYLTAAIDAATGERLWTAAPSEVCGPFDSCEPSAVLVSPDGQLVLVAGRRPNVTPARSSMFAYDATTGAVVWESTLGGTNLVEATSGGVPRAVLVTFGPLIALDHATGAVLWEADDGGPDIAPLDTVVSVDRTGGRLFAARRGAGFRGLRAFALSLLDGSTLWATEVPERDDRFNSVQGIEFGPSANPVIEPGDIVTVLSRRELPAPSPLVSPPPGTFLLLSFRAADGQLLPSAALDPGSDGILPRTLGRVGLDFLVATGDAKRDGWANTIAYDRDALTMLTPALGGDAMTTLRYNGPVDGIERLVRLVVGPDQRRTPAGGRFYVLMSSTGCGTDDDIAVVAYQLCAGFFTDVPCSYWAVRAIENAFAQDLLRGFGDGTYRPDQGVSRAQGAVLLARAADRIAGDLDSFTPPACGSEHFLDVPCDHFAFRFVEYLVTKNVVAVPVSRLFNSDGTLDRGAQAAYAALVIHLRDGDLFSFTPPPCGSESFSDVPCTLTDEYLFVEYLRSKGVTSGFGDGTFRPDAPVTRAQMAVFLLRALNIDP